jgi:hypothetical protein
MKDETKHGLHTLSPYVAEMRKSGQGSPTLGWAHDKEPPVLDAFAEIYGWADARMANANHSLDGMKLRLAESKEPARPGNSASDSGRTVSRVPLGPGQHTPADSDGRSGSSGLPQLTGPMENTLSLLKTNYDEMPDTASGLPKKVDRASNVAAPSRVLSAPKSSFPVTAVNAKREGPSPEGFETTPYSE